MIKKKKVSKEERIIERRKELAKNGQVAAIWTRVSSADQYKTNCSIETQLEGCRNYCNRNNIRIKHEFGGENESAKEAGDLFMEMIGEVLNDPEYNTIIVYDFDRFSRNSDDGIYYKTKVKKNGINVISVNQPIDANNILASQLENFLIILADIDNAMRRHKCYNGMVSCINRGEWFSRPPIGYDTKKVDKHHIITVNEKGKILKRAFEWIANEPSITQFEIQSRLKAQGLDLPKQTLSSCLHNSFYCGRLEHQYLNTDTPNIKYDRHGNPYIMGVQEPLISEELFEKVQDVLDGNRNHYEQATETPKFPLKKHLYCAKDHRLLTGYTTKGNDYYKCGMKGCKTNVSATIVHDQFKNILDRYIIPSEISTIFAKVLERKFQEKEGADVEAARNIKKKLETLKTKLKTVNRRYALDEIEKDVYDDVKKDLLMEINATEHELRQSEAKLSNLSKYVGNSITIASKLGSYWNKMDYKLCQMIQKMAFPQGILWDGERKALRTDGENIFLSELSKLQHLTLDEGIKKQDTQSDVSCLVAGGGFEPPTSGL